MRRVRQLAILAAASAALAIPASASAQLETAKIGSTLATPSAAGVCNNNCLSFQLARPSSVFPITSPANGVITEWGVRSNDPDALYHLRVLSPVGGAYLATGSVTAPAPVPPGTVDTTFAYPAPNLPIKKGDSIALLQTGNADVGLPQVFTTAVDVIANNFQARPAVGEAIPLGPDVNTQLLGDANHELLLQATISFCRVPTLTGLTIAAAAQALTNAGCGPATVTKTQFTLKPLKGSKKKRKKIKQENAVTQAKNEQVLAQETAPSETVAPGGTVKVTVGEVVKPTTKKKKKKKKKK